MLTVLTHNIIDQKHFGNILGTSLSNTRNSFGSIRNVIVTNAPSFKAFKQLVDTVIHGFYIKVDYLSQTIQRQSRHQLSINNGGLEETEL